MNAAPVSAAETPLFAQGLARPGGYRDITVAQLRAMRPWPRIVDVREPSEWSGELPALKEAMLVPLASVVSKAAGWSPDEEIVLICRSGRRSARAAEELVRRGFRYVMNLDGGMLAVYAGPG